MKNTFKNFDLDKDPTPPYSRIITRNSFVIKGVADNVNTPHTKSDVSKKVVKSKDLQASVSSDVAKSVGKSCSQQEVQAILNELRE